MINKLLSVSLLYFFVFIPWVALAQFPSGEWSYEEADIWLLDQSHNTEARLNGLLAIAERYQKDGYLQEAVWAYREAKAFERAELLESELKSILLTSVVEKVGELRGIESPKKMKVGDRRFFGVFKRSDSRYVQEVITYKLDRLLGLDITPVTVIREHPNYGTGSLRYFVSNAITGRDYYENPKSKGEARTMGGPNFRIYEYPESYKNMWLLDFLIGNDDRHGRNWLIKPNGKIIAIDHSNTSIGPVIRRTKFLKVKDNMLPTGKVLQALENLKFEDFTEFEKYKSFGIDVSFIFKRRELLMERIKFNNLKSSCRKVFSN